MAYIHPIRRDWSHKVPVIFKLAARHDDQSTTQMTDKN